MRNSSTIVLLGYVYGQPHNPMADKFPNFICFTLSVKRKWKDSDGQEKTDMTWYKCRTWSEGLSKIIRNSIKGGEALIVKGYPKATAYIDKEGVAKGQIEVLIEDINILSPRKEEDSNDSIQHISETNTQADNGKFKVATKSPIPEIEVPDDEIPF